MSPLKSSGLLFYLLFIALLLIVTCQLPEDPADPSNTAIYAVIQTPDSINHEHVLVDTVGKMFRIGAALKLPDNFDSVQMVITLEDDITLDTMLSGPFAADVYFDTIWTEYTFFIPGVYYVTLSPKTDIKLTPATLTLTLRAAADMPVNHPPVLLVSGASVIAPGSRCLLVVEAEDQDAGQIHTVVMSHVPDGAELVGDAFKWLAPTDFIGLDTVIFIATDNGYPKLSDTATVVITVTATPHAPKITVTGKQSIAPLETCTLTVYASDEDAGQSVTISLEEHPEGSEISSDSLFIWTAPAGAAGASYTVSFTVSDNGVPPLSSSASVQITVSAGAAVNHAPVWNLASLPLSLNDTASYSLDLSTLCSDPDDNTLLYSLLPGLPAGDTITEDSYSFTATPAAIGTYTVALVATDPDGANDTLYIAMTIESSATDNSAPVITLSAPATDSAVSATESYTIAVICSDASAIASVSASFGSTVVPATLEDDHYTMTITGLQPGVFTTVTITATDASVNKNEKVTKVYLTRAQTYTVSYDGNGSTAGTVPVDAGAYETGTSVTVKGNSGSLVKTGSTFAGWNSAADGSGTAYAAGATFKMGGADVTLYARWTTNPTYTVVYKGNGSTTGTVPVDAGAYETGTSVTVKGNSGNLVKTGSTFAGWNSAADGSGTAYAAGATFEMGGADVTLYAQWTKKQYTITYDGNGKSGGAVPVDDVQYDSLSTVTVAPNSGGLKKTGYTFAGWNTATNGSGINYTAGTGTFTIKASTTLYAKWTVKTYTLTYLSNGNTGGSLPSSDSPYDSNTTITVAGNTGNLTKTGFDFNGWNTSAEGSGTGYSAGASLTIKSDMTLNAQWKVKQYTVTYYGNGNTSGSAPIDATPYDSNATVILAGVGTMVNTGNDFKGWNTSSLGGGTSYPPTNGSLIIKNDVKLYAQWAPTTHQVIFTTHGGSSVATKTVNHGSLVAEPTSTLSGLTLVGWYTESEYSNLWNFGSRTVDTDVTLHAKWQVMDKDGNVYDTVRIGNQTWMVQNLKTTKYNDGSPIGTGPVTDQDAWINRTTPAYCWPDGNAANGEIYGALYNHFAARSTNLAPSGWHIPSLAEFDTLNNYFNSHGISYEGVPFEVRTGGYREEDGTYVGVGSIGIWWTTTVFAAQWYFSPSYDIGGGSSSSFYRSQICGISIRCIKD